MIAFVEDPTGYKWEIIGGEEGNIPEPIAQAGRPTGISLTCSVCTDFCGYEGHREGDAAQCQAKDWLQVLQLPSSTAGVWVHACS